MSGMPPVIELRDYQKVVFNQIRRLFSQGVLRIILSLPTGAGKTYVACALIALALAKGSRVAFVADRKQLVRQTARRLQALGIAHGMIMGKDTYGSSLPVQVCSSQTLEKRGFSRRFDLVIVDEAHDVRKSFLNFLINAELRVIGLTATPFTRGLGLYYQEIVTGATTDELLEQGWLTPLRVFWPPKRIITDNVRVKKTGEFDDVQVVEQASAIVGDIVSEWTRYTHRVYGGPVKTLAFVPRVAYGADLCRQFQQHGFLFEQISFRDQDTDREDRVAGLEQGALHGLVSVDALSRGMDIEDIQCIVWARPLNKSFATWIQGLGRGMRACERIAKKDCILLDFTSHKGKCNWERFEAQTYAFWANGWPALDGGKRKKRKVEPPKEPRSVECRSCHFMFPAAAEECPFCGAARPTRRSNVQTHAGYLTERERAAGAGGSIGDPWPHICALARDKHPYDGERALKWARVQHKSLTGKWPEWGRPFQPAPVCDPRIADQVNANFRNWQKQRFAIRRSIERREERLATQSKGTLV